MEGLRGTVRRFRAIHESTQAAEAMQHIFVSNPTEEQTTEQSSTCAYALEQVDQKISDYVGVVPDLQATSSQLSDLFKNSACAGVKSGSKEGVPDAEDWGAFWAFRTVAFKVHDRFYDVHTEMQTAVKEMFKVCHPIR